MSWFMPFRRRKSASVAQYVTVDVDKVQVKIDRGKEISLLEIDIEIPCDPEPSSLKRRDRTSRAARSQRLAVSSAH